MHGTVIVGRWGLPTVRLSGAVKDTLLTVKLTFMAPPVILYVPIIFEKLALTRLKPCPVALTTPELAVTVPDSPPLSCILFRTKIADQP